MITSKENLSDKQTPQHQVSTADDKCQLTEALQSKLKEGDKLIQAETSETGRVSIPLYLYLRHWASFA